MVTRRIFILFAVLLLLFPASAYCAQALSIASFENSSFLKNYRLREKDSWSLKSGGRNFFYGFHDPENSYSGISVELSASASDIKKIAVSWYGASTYQPATLTKTKQQFLRDLLLVVIPTVSPDKVIGYVRSHQSKNYPGGGNSIPRARIEKITIYAGTVGEALIVGIEK